MTVEKMKPSGSHVQSWVVQKFGGTSIGKYPLNIVENVVKPATCHHRVVVVCSARSTSTKDVGTTNRLLQAYQHCLGISLERSNTLIQSIRADHISAAYGYIKNPKLITKLVQEIEHQCEQVIQLLQATRTIGHGTSHIMDRVISTGERLAASFLSAVLSDRGISSEAVDFSDIIPSNMHSTMDQAFYDNVACVMAERIKLCQATVPVVTGFFGPIGGGLLAQVGRGYTDFCASMISVGLRAHELHVWKEVEGIFTADPSKVPSARMLPIISSDEASELTFHGSEVIHYSAMRLAMRAKVSMRIKNVLNPQAPGTLVVDDCKSASPSPILSPTGSSRAPIAITSKDKILLINVRSTERLKAHSFLASIFSVLDKCNMSIDLICTSEVQVSMALHSQIYPTDEEDSSDPVRKDVKIAIKQLQEYGEVELLHSRTIISLVGKQMRQALSVTGQMFSTLSENRIRIDMIAQGASQITMSCVVQDHDAGRAVALLHAVFFTSI
ncbi:putative aspartate kinase, partial [Dactylonectria macrodidyma]